MTGAYFARVVVYEGVAADDKRTDAAVFHAFLVKLAALIPDALTPPAAFARTVTGNADETRTVRVVLDVWLPRTCARASTDVWLALRPRLREHLPTLLQVLELPTLPPIQA